MARADMESASSKRQSLQAAGVQLPEVLSASFDVGARYHSYHARRNAIQVNMLDVKSRTNGSQ